MNVTELCKCIELDDDASRIIAGFENNAQIQQIIPQFKSFISGLTEPETASNAQLKLETKLKDSMFAEANQNGLLILYFHLKAACLSFEKYAEKGISNEIFTETMKCFSRFVNEHKTSFYKTGFDRAFWTYRQLSLQLFRIGQLEYEIISPKESAIHIPSDADISLDKCRASFEEYCEFLASTFKMRPSRFSLDSWLISPALDELLEPSSKIISFKNCFELEEWNKDSDEYKQWIFGKDNISVDEMPELTSLQRKAKALLRRGGKIGTAQGFLKSF